MPETEIVTTGGNEINKDVANSAILDPSAWVDRYGDYLFRYAMLRLRDRSAAEDLVQETFLAALSARGSFAGNSTESTWMVGILKHKIADHFRRRNREVPLGDDDLREDRDPSSFDGSGHWTSGPTEWGGNPAELYRERKFLDQLTECLSGLPPHQAKAFTLREIEGAGTGEICKVLNVTETNLWVILHRARMQLRRCLETRWFHRKTEKEP
jgi:RNA polymerase sigma-70 factor (ECF subfamily)